MSFVTQLVLQVLLASTSPASATTSPAPAVQAVQSGQAAPTWVHVRVDGAGSDDVTLDLPLSAARMVLDLAGQQAVTGGRVKVDDVDVSLAELRAAWKAVRAFGGPLVTVKEADQTVRIGVEGGKMKVRVSGAGEDVHVEVPAAVVDALLAGEGDTLELGAAMDALTRHGAGELVRVAAADQKIRIWID